MKKNNIRCHVLNYHIIWCTKYRFKVLKNKVEAELKELLENICSKYGYDLVEIETMPDHVHLFVSTGVSESPADVVRTLKSISARELFKKFPDLKKFYGRCGVMWSRGYFIGTAGKASSETIRRYIAEQKTSA